MVGGLDPEQVPALQVPERLPARIRKWEPQLGVCGHVCEVSAESSVPEAVVHVFVSCNEPPLMAVIKEHRCGLAKRVQSRIRILDEVPIRWIECQPGWRLLDPTHSGAPREAAA